jgi:hypothetical protein
MELIAFDDSKVVYLLDMFRPAGQLYQPEAATKIVQRYSFMKFPSVENLVKNERNFGIGKFRDIQINEFNIYSDGVIVSSGSDTDAIDAFVDDVLAWAKEEFGIVQLTDGFPPERAYESSMVVKSDADLMRALAPKNDMSTILNKIYHSDRGYVGGDIGLTGFIAAVDRSKFTGRRKPISFTLDRRLGLPFENNIYFSMAPLRTKDHLEVLRSIERLALTAS